MSSPGSEAARLLGQRFRAERVRVGITQMDLAHLAGLNVANYGRIERGKGNPSFQTIIRLAGVLGKDPSIFVRGIGLDAIPEAARPYTAAEFLREKRARER